MQNYQVFETDALLQGHLGVKHKLQSIRMESSDLPEKTKVADEHMQSTRKRRRKVIYLPSLYNIHHYLWLH